MKKVIVAVVAALAVSLGGCGSQPAQYNDGYMQQPAPQQVIVRDNDSHMDALIAGAAGVAAGKMLSDRSYRNRDRNYSRRYDRPYRSQSRTIFSSRPSRSSVFSSSPRRSSGFGSYRSRR